MRSSVNQPGIFSSRVVRRRVVCEEHAEIALHVRGFPLATPGQFVQVLCRSAPGDDEAVRRTRALEAWPRSDGSADVPLPPLLRRPFSLGGLRRFSDGCEIDLLFRIVGPGTAWLAGRRSGDLVEVMGPLGRGFAPPPADCRALLVAGGIGLPPIRWLGEILTAAGMPCACVCGSRTRAILPVTLDGEPPANGVPGPYVREFAQHGIDVVVTTDDGSCGVHGTVGDGLLHLLGPIADVGGVRVFACGPHGMLQAVAASCHQRGLSCQVAMERMMACGMGTCQSCVVPVHDEGAKQRWRYALCCAEGPVFDASKVIWRQP